MQGTLFEQIDQDSVEVYLEGLVTFAGIEPVFYSGFLYHPINHY
ncbi:hypothetical protein [Methyloprofundus sedimenti]|nr:hypothetical protein [Methyloprofundus sedimenti]